MTIRYPIILGNIGVPGWETDIELLSIWLTCMVQAAYTDNWQEQLQTSAEDAFIYTVLKHLAY